MASEADPEVTKKMLHVSAKVIERVKEDIVFVIDNSEEAEAHVASSDADFDEPVITQYTRADGTKILKEYT